MNTEIKNVVDPVEETNNPTPHPILSTRKLLRKVRGTKNHKCALAFFAVLEGLRCQ